MKRPVKMNKHILLILYEKEIFNLTKWVGKQILIQKQERKNLRLQKTHLPVRYREGMPEFSD